jgi:hypothetical protein
MDDIDFSALPAFVKGVRTPATTATRRPFPYRGMAEVRRARMAGGSGTAPQTIDRRRASAWSILHSRRLTSIFDPMEIEIPNSLRRDAWTPGTVIPAGADAARSSARG